VVVGLVVVIDGGDTVTTLFARIGVVYRRGANPVKLGCNLYC